MTRTFFVPEGFKVLGIGAVPRADALADSRVPVAVSLGSGSLGGHTLHSIGFVPAAEIDLEIRLGPDGRRELVRERRSELAARTFHEAILVLVENAGDVPAPLTGDRSVEPAFAPSDLPSIEGSAVEMVIVTSSELAGPFQELADWKTRKGVPTVVRTTDWIDASYPSGHDRPERIRLFLRDAYSKWGTVFVLLGGDWNTVPSRRAFNRFVPGGVAVNTDQYYACLDGDWNADGDAQFAEGQFHSDPGDGADLFPDLFVGRAPVSSVDEASTFVAKSFTYDRSPPTGYVEDVCHLAEVFTPYDWRCGDPPEAIVLDGATWTGPGGLDDFIDPTWARTFRFQSDCNLDRDIALLELDAGHHLLTVGGHSDATRFEVGDGQNPFVFTIDARALTNGDRLMIALFLPHFSNEFELESYGEGLMNNPDGGAVAVLGSTNLVVPHQSAAFAAEQLRLAFSRGISRLGIMSQLHRVPFAALSQADSSEVRWTSLTQHLLGDPELRMWLQEPRALTVTHAASVVLGTAAIVVGATDETSAPVPDALVTVAGPGIYTRARTDAGGQAALAITGAGVGSPSIVVTKPGFLPEESLLAILPIAAAQLSVISHAIDDDAAGGSSGNGDGVLDAGETIELEVTVRNDGGSPANAVALTAGVESGTSATFDILCGGVRDPARVFVGPDGASPPSIPFTLEFESPTVPYIGKPTMTFAADDSAAGDEGAFLWQDCEGWHLRWSHGPDAVVVSGTVTTTGRVRHATSLELEAGEALSLDASADVLAFAGATGPQDVADGFDFRLADGTMLAVTGALDFLGNIPAGSTGTGTVVLQVSTTPRDGQVGAVDLALGSSSGGPWTAEIPVLLAAPSLEPILLSIDDSDAPPLSGNGNGVVEAGETIRLVPTVLNRGGGAAVSVVGTVSAASGFELLDAADVYGEIPSLGQSSGVDGYVVTVTNGGSSLDLALGDGTGRTWEKTIELVAPAAPQGLAAQAMSSSISLTWAANSEEDLAGYNVYRNEGAGYVRENFDLLRSGSRFVREGLPPATTFHFRATAVDVSGNESAPSAEIGVWTAQKQVDGWPAHAGGNVFSSIAIGDADSGNGEELYVGSFDARLYAWDRDARARPGFPVATDLEVWSTPALADLDSDGDLEIFSGSGDGRLYAVHHDGTPVFPPNLYLVDLGDGVPIRTSVTVCDIDQDSDPEILFGTDDGRVYAFQSDGTGVGDPSGLLFTAAGGLDARIWGPIAVADVDADGVPEIAFASWNDSLYVITPDGVVEPGFPRGASGSSLNDYRSGPVIGDLDRDGTMEIVAGNANGALYAYHHDGSGYPGPDGVFATIPEGIRSLPALANLDDDPELEVVVGGLDGNLYAYHHDGSSLLPGAGGLLAAIDSSAGISASPIVVDVDGDVDFEILVGHRNGSFYAFHHDGAPVVGTPIVTLGPIYSTAAAADIDADGDVDIAFASYDQTVNVIDFGGVASPSSFEWPTYAGSNSRTSAYGDRGPLTAPSAVSGALALAQSVPNPFQRSTKIAYVVPGDGRATLQVYDVSGRLVRTLASGPATPGSRVAIWDGRDGRGRPVSSGVYFYRLESEGDSITRKTLLLR